MIIKTLKDVSLEQLYNCFIEAFSAYETPMNLSLESYQGLLKRRGYDAELSVGLFDQEHLVGFITNGSDSFKGSLSAYDLGTGIIKKYRGQGYSKDLLHKAIQILKANNIKHYYLEVLENNIPAKTLYTKAGFIETGFLRCYKKDVKTSLTYKSDEVVIIGSDISLREFEEHFDQEPSWQNSISSIQRSSNSFTKISIKKNNEEVALAVFDKTSGDIPLLVVNKDTRREGYASMILQTLNEISETNTLKILNVNDTNHSLKGFLDASGFDNFINQYEMVLEL